MYSYHMARRCIIYLIKLFYGIRSSYQSPDFYFFNTVQNIDAVDSGFIITVDRKEKVEFTYAIWAEADGIIVPKPGEESRLFAFIRPFQPTVCYAMSIIFCFLFIPIISYDHKVSLQFCPCIFKLVSLQYQPTHLSIRI